MYSSRTALIAEDRLRAAAERGDVFTHVAGQLAMLPAPDAGQDAAGETTTPGSTRSGRHSAE